MKQKRRLFSGVLFLLIVLFHCSFASDDNGNVNGDKKPVWRYNTIEGATLDTVEEDRGKANRRLYPVFPVQGGNYSVDTISRNVSGPSGIEVGYFKGHYGLFVSSMSMFTISFLHYLTFERTLVAGTPNVQGGYDAQLLYSMFECPSRMAYDTNNNRLFVSERKSGNIRILDFPSDQTKTLFYSETKEKVTFLRNIQMGTFPGMDLQIGDDVLYVVDTVKLYSVVASDGSGLSGLPYSGAVVTEYSGFTTYLSSKGYEFSATSGSFIYSVTPDTSREMLYVTVSFARNVILQVPMDPSASYASIEVLIGNENSVYSQNGQGAIPPQTRNGNINVLLSDSPSSSPTSQPSSLSIDRRLRRLDEKESKVYPSNILLACPMHARMSPDMSVLYFTEAYPTTSGDMFFFGSQTVRRFVFATGEVDTYAGVDQSHNASSIYTLIGGEGGTRDGLVQDAEFIYPISFAILGGGVSSSEDGERFDNLAIADYSAHTIRRVYAYMDTHAPTSSPTEYIPPTHSPTPSPTSLAVASAATSDYSTPILITSLFSIAAAFLFGIGMCFCTERRKDKSQEGKTSPYWRILPNFISSFQHVPRYDEMDNSETTCSTSPAPVLWSDIIPGKQRGNSVDSVDL